MARKRKPVKPPAENPPLERMDLPGTLAPWCEKLIADEYRNTVRGLLEHLQERLKCGSDKVAVPPAAEKALKEIIAFCKAEDGRGLEGFSKLVGWLAVRLGPDKLDQVHDMTLREFATALRAAKRETLPAESTATLAVSESGKLILVALRKHYPVLQSIAKICTTLEVNVSEKTISTELKELIDAGLATRPKGERKGATLTPAGKALAETLAAK